MAASIEEVLQQMVALCEKQDLEFVVMGGLAVRVHGIPRPTYDVDIAITVDQGRLEQFFEDAQELGYTVAEPFRTGWRDEVGGMPLVRLKTFLTEAQSVDVDIFLNETPYLRSVMDRRMQVDFDDGSMSFVTPEDLILLKLLANRPRDLGDVSDILFVQGELDTKYMYRWADALGIAERLTTALDN
ncbi:MAG: nucleotidyl transferase AbiEii/AbiGii toxin family protein [bacterium]|nr:nucleotidyl transferase AbiEii/AbiGii toxin family protein [bacterium]